MAKDEDCRAGAEAGGGTRGRRLARGRGAKSLLRECRRTRGAGKTLSLQELEVQYGAKKEDADKVAASLARFGLKMEGVCLLTRSMRASGTAAQIEAAFQPKMAMYRIPGQIDRRLREGGLMIPADLEGLVTGVFGIDERCMAKPKLSVSEKAKADAHKALSPQYLEKLYNFPPGDGTSQQIAIAEFGGGYFADDAALYAQTFGLPVPDVGTIPVNAPVLTLDAAGIYRGHLDLLPNWSVEETVREEPLGGLEVAATYQKAAGISAFARISSEGLTLILEPCWRRYSPAPGPSRSRAPRSKPDGSRPCSGVVDVMDDIKGLTPHASRVTELCQWRQFRGAFTYLCWNIPVMTSVTLTIVLRSGT